PRVAVDWGQLPSLVEEDSDQDAPREEEQPDAPPGEEQGRGARLRFRGGPSAGGEVVPHDDEQEVAEIVRNLPGRLHEDRAPDGREDQDRQQGADAARRQAQRVKLPPINGNFQIRSLGTHGASSEGSLFQMSSGGYSLGATDYPRSCPADHGGP